MTARSPLQNPRLFMVAIAALGVLDTAYITYEKLSAAQSSLCTAGCSTVLSSSYATVFGLPLGLFGLGAYGVVLLLAGVPLLKQEDPEVQEQRSQQTGFALFLVTAAMALFSGYLMYVLATDIQAVCYFCIASAIFSVSLLVLSLVSQREKLTELIFPGAITAMVTLVGAIALFTPSAQGMVPGATAIGDTSGNTFFYVNTPSSDAETQLAEHLKAIDAKMYGAYWCPHCCEQKRLFGATAMKQLKYVECGEGGQNAQVDTCRDLAPVIEKATGEKFGFPTWEINGQFYSGRQPLTELARLSDYKGPQNFQNTFGICPSP